MTKIIVKIGGSNDVEKELGAEPVSIGRDTANDIVLPDPSISRRHARIERGPSGSHRIIDLDSGNGVVHRGKRVASLDLYPGCVVDIGVATLEVVSDARAPALVLISGAPQRAFPLASGETIAGRSPEAHVPVPDPLVSSRHLKIVRRGEVFAVVDLDSENGTRVNGVRVSSKELQQGDQIQVGGFTFFFARDGVVPPPDSIQVIQPAQTPSSPSVPEPSSRAPVPAPPEARPSPVETPSTRPRLLLAGAGLLVALFLLVLFVLVRSPDDAAEREFQQVFQAELSADAQERIAEYLTRAEEYQATDNLELAMEQYQKILVLEPTHQQALAETARLEEAIQRQEASRAERDRAERETLARVGELAERAASLVGAAKFDEARSVLEEARALAPESEVLTSKLVESHIAEGDHFRTRGDSRRARAAYESALSLEPGNSAARRALSTMDRTVQASQDRQKRIDELTEQGLAQLRREEFQQAYASFSEVLSLDAGNARAREFRDQASQLLEGQVRPLYEEGVRLYNAGELAPAMARLHEVLARNPDHADTKAFLAQAASRVRSQAVEIYKRAYIYEGLGRFREALDLYQQCLALLPDKREEYHQKAAQRIAELSRKLP